MRELHTLPAQPWGEAPKVAVIHDWLVTYGGAERVLEDILECFPDADLFAVVDFLPEVARSVIGRRAVHTTFLQRWPGIQRWYWYYLPLMPLAIEQLDLSGYDIILSSHYAIAKGVLAGPDQLHLSYINSPVRFVWDLQNYYLDSFGWRNGIKGLLARLMFHYVRIWDARSADGVDIFVANSHFIARRVEKAYRRHPDVLYPGIDTEKFGFQAAKEDYYLTTSFLTPFKRVDLIVEAFNGLPDHKLIVIGEGPELPRLRAMAGPNVRILGHRPFAEMRDYLQRARAFVFAPPEDFGLVMAEAQSCGTPVIAYGRGGAVEVVRPLGRYPESTGVLFEEQNPDALRTAVRTFEAASAEGRITPEACRANAMRFTRERFQQSLTAIVRQHWDAFRARPEHPRPDVRFAPCGCELAAAEGDKR